MSVFAHLNTDHDEYDLYISNEQIENQIQGDQLSSASNWTINLDDNIEFSDLTYMRGTTCDIGLSKFWIDSFPLTYSNDEFIEVHIKLQEELGRINQLFSSVIIKKRFNTQAYLLPLENFSATDHEFALDFLNKKMSVPITNFLLRATLKIVLDTDIFSHEHLSPMTLEDVKLIHRYIDCALFSRREIHRHLQSKLVEKDDIDSLVTFQSTDLYTRSKEAKTIRTSHVLRPLEDRPRSRDSNSMNLELFYSIDLSKADTMEANGPKVAIISDTEQFVQELGAEVRTDSNDGTNTRPLTDTSKEALKDLISANKALIYQALQARNMLTILREKADKRRKPTAKDKEMDLFQLVYDLNSGKIHCETYTKNFLCDDGTQVIVKLPTKCSYKLGARPGQSLELRAAHEGALQNTGDISRSTHTLTNKLQSPPCCIRPYPRIIHVITDLVGPLKRDLWLSHTRFENYNIIYSLIIDETAIANKFISKQHDDILYYKMSNLKNSLNSVEIFLIDENFQQVDFSSLCYCRLAIKIKVTTPS